MGKLISLIAVALTALSISNANALTLGEGDVIRDGRVVNVLDSPTTKLIVEMQGYHIGGGKLVLNGVDGLVAIKLVELAGKSREGVIEAVTDVVIADAVINHLDEIISDEVIDRVVSDEVIERVEREVVDKLVLTYRMRLRDDVEALSRAREAIEAGRQVVMCSGGGCDRWEHELVMHNGNVEWHYEADI